MPVPVVNLKPALEATEPQWRARLEEMFARMHFILGEQVAAFEKEFAAATGAAFAVGAGNGTDALALCLRDAGLANSGHEVLTSALTAPFTAVAIQAAQSRPEGAEHILYWHALALAAADRIAAAKAALERAASEIAAKAARLRDPALKAAYLSSKTARAVAAALGRD